MAVSYKKLFINAFGEIFKESGFEVFEKLTNEKRPLPAKEFAALLKLTEERFCEIFEKHGLAFKRNNKWVFSEWLEQQGVLKFPRKTGSEHMRNQF